jgi:PAS domain-containing protein
MEELQGLRSLVADAPVGVLIADAHTGRVLTVNHEAERINGFAHRPEFGWTEYEKAFVRRRIDGHV